MTFNRPGDFLLHKDSYCVQGVRPQAKRNEAAFSKTDGQSLGGVILGGETKSRPLPLAKEQ